MRDERERLLDVLEAIERIEKYGARGKAALRFCRTWDKRVNDRRL